METIDTKETIGLEEIGKLTPDEKTLLRFGYYSSVPPDERAERDWLEEEEAEDYLPALEGLWSHLNLARNLGNLYISDDQKLMVKFNKKLQMPYEEAVYRMWLIAIKLVHILDLDQDPLKEASSIDDETTLPKYKFPGNIDARTRVFNLIQAYTPKH